jgi:hypothetical protein
MLEAEFYACEDDSPSVFVRFSYSKSQSLCLRGSPAPPRLAGGHGRSKAGVDHSHALLDVDAVRAVVRESTLPSAHAIRGEAGG